MWISQLAAILIFLPCYISATMDKVVCYYGTWSIYRNGNGKFAIQDIDPTLCTHLIYTFVGLNPDGSIHLLDSYLDVDTGGFKNFNNLKTINPNLKTLLAIGGWNEGSLIYSQVVANPLLRSVLVQSAVDLLKTYGFDGFDFDWEYPGQRGGSSLDKENYVKLISEFRSEFDKHGFLLTAAVAAARSSVNISYDVPALSRYLDFINVMTYDLHGSWDGVTGGNAPLYPSSIDVNVNQKMLNVHDSISGWIENGADPSKLVLGMGVYGRTFTLSNPSNNGIGAPTSGPGNPGPYTQESGMLGYNEICELHQAGGWTVVWNSEQMVPHAYKKNQWVSYDSPDSIIIKVNFAKSLGLGGVMIWSIETDDFKGICGPKYPILSTINYAIKHDIVVSTPLPVPVSTGFPSATTSSHTTGVPSSTTPGPLPEEICTHDGYIADPKDCNKFYYCLFYKNTYIMWQFSCAAGLLYDRNANQCNYDYLVTC